MKVLSRQNHGFQGFTLVELIITITIVAIIATMAAPPMQKQIQQAKTREAANVFESALKEARSQALITQNNVIIRVDTTNKRIIMNSGATNAGGNTSRTYQLDNSVNISQVASAPNTITFTATKGAYQDTDTDSTKGQKMVLGMGYGFCVNRGLIKATVMIDANSNISMQESSVNGSCS